MGLHINLKDVEPDKEYLVLNENGYYIAYSDYDNIDWDTGEILEKPSLSFRTAEEYRRIPLETILAIFDLEKLKCLFRKNMILSKDFSKIKENKEYLIAERYKGKIYYHIGTPWFSDLDSETGELLEDSYLHSFACTDELIIDLKDVIGIIELEEPIIL